MASSSYYAGLIDGLRASLNGDEQNVGDLVTELRTLLDIPTLEEGGTGLSETMVLSDSAPLTGLIQADLLDGDPEHDAQLAAMGIIRDGKNYYFDTDGDGEIGDKERASWMTKGDKKIVMHTEGANSFQINSLAIYGNIKDCDRLVTLTKCKEGDHYANRNNDYGSSAPCNMIVMEVDEVDSEGAYKNLTNKVVKNMDKFLVNLGNNEEISHSIGSFSQSSTGLLEYIVNNDTYYTDVYFAYPPNVGSRSLNWERLSNYNIHICESEKDESRSGNNAVYTIYDGQGLLNKFLLNAKSVSITVPGLYYHQAIDVNNEISDSAYLVSLATSIAKEIGREDALEIRIAEGYEWYGHDEGTMGNGAKSAMRYSVTWEGK